MVVVSQYVTEHGKDQGENKPAIKSSPPYASAWLRSHVRLCPAWSGERITMERCHCACSCGRPDGIVWISPSTVSLLSHCVASRVSPKYHTGCSLATYVVSFWSKVLPLGIGGKASVQVPLLGCWWWEGIGGVVGRHIWIPSVRHRLFFFYLWRILLHHRTAETTSIYPDSVNTMEDCIAFLEGMGF